MVMGLRVPRSLLKFLDPFDKDYSILGVYTGLSHKVYSILGSILVFLTRFIAY